MLYLFVCISAGFIGVFSARAIENLYFSFDSFKNFITGEWAASIKVRKIRNKVFLEEEKAYSLKNKNYKRITREGYSKECSDKLATMKNFFTKMTYITTFLITSVFCFMKAPAFVSLWRNKGLFQKITSSSFLVWCMVTIVIMALIVCIVSSALNYVVKKRFEILLVKKYFYDCLATDKEHGGKNAD